MEILAPGVIKLFGEHAVVYGKLSIAAAIGVYAKCKAERIEINNENKELFRIELKDLNKSISISNEDIDKVYNDYLNRKSIDEFVDSQGIDHEILPYIIIAGKIRKARNLSLSNTEVVITSDIPMTRGLASILPAPSLLCITLSPSLASSIIWLSGRFMLSSFASATV